MLARLSYFLSKAHYRLQRVLWPNDKQKLYNKWFANKGDQTLRVDYPLSNDSLVFDLGGYKGLWAENINARYGCTVYVFEPVKDYAEAMKHKFAGNHRVRVFPFGLSAIDRTATIGLSDDASSVFRPTTDAVEVEMRDVVDFLHKEQVTHIDLMKINIEGGEYELLEAIIEHGLCEIIENLQIQFHEFLPDAEARMIAIQRSLEATHDLTWQYRFIWENWKRRGKY